APPDSVGSDRALANGTNHDRNDFDRRTTDLQYDRMRPNVESNRLSHSRAVAPTTASDGSGVAAILYDIDPSLVGKRHLVGTRLLRGWKVHNTPAPILHARLALRGHHESSPLRLLQKKFKWQTRAGLDGSPRRQYRLALRSECFAFLHDRPREFATAIFGLS